MKRTDLPARRAFLCIIGSRAPRIAYTLNGQQPVRCSIVGSQPLFHDQETDHEPDHTPAP